MKGGHFTLITAFDEHSFRIATYFCKEGIQLPRLEISFDLS